MRPGEKLFEELSTDAEHADKTKHPKIFIGRIKPHDSERVTKSIDALLDVAHVGSADTQTLKEALGEIVPEYRYAVARQTVPQSRPKTDAENPTEAAN